MFYLFKGMLCFLLAYFAVDAIKKKFSFVRYKRPFIQRMQRPALQFTQKGSDYWKNVMVRWFHFLFSLLKVATSTDLGNSALEIQC